MSSIQRPHPLPGLLLFVTLLVAGAAPLGAQDPPSEETMAFFRTNCASCHTIGGGVLTGPDLKDVLKRRDEEWLVPFLLDPRGVIDSGDPYGQALLQEARGVYMTQVPGMTRELAGKLLRLIEAESALEKSHFAGLQISDRALTEADVELGRELFLGGRALASGAPACVSCHTVEGIGSLGGGRLGPDLTAAYARLEGRKAMSAWLSSPPSVVMQPVFRGRELDPEEILALVAYLQRTAESGEDQARPTSLSFVLAGFATCAALLVVFDIVWRGRFRSVRRAMVARS